MARELAVTIYLFIFRLLFNSFKLFPQKKKTVVVASFGDNIMYTLKELEKQTEEQVVMLKSSSCKITFKDTPNRKQLSFTSINPVDWVKSIYHLATCHKIFVDNYYGLLAVTVFKPNTECIQLWHAAGGITQFGLKDLSIENRSANAYERFQQVYQRYDHVLVGSHSIAAIYKSCFALVAEKILATIVSRIDICNVALSKEAIVNIIYILFLIIHEKKLPVYAATYRHTQLNVSYLKLYIKTMY